MMMDTTTYRYQKAAPQDADCLAWLRVEVLRDANSLVKGEEMKQLYLHSLDFYRMHLGSHEHACYLAYAANDELAGCGDIVFQQVLPAYYNPSGWKAYIMNLYTRPPHRRRGVATRLLDRLMVEADQRHCHMVSLETTPMSRPLYLAYGFLPVEDEMRTPPMNPQFW